MNDDARQQACRVDEDVGPRLASLATLDVERVANAIEESLASPYIRAATRLAPGRQVLGSGPRSPSRAQRVRNAVDHPPACWLHACGGFPWPRERAARNAPAPRRSRRSGDAAFRYCISRQLIERARACAAATLGPTTERQFSRRRETSMRSVAFSQQGGAEHRRHQQTIAKTEFVLKRESHGIVVQLAAVAQQPNPREPQKYD